MAYLLLVALGLITLSSSAADERSEHALREFKSYTSTFDRAYSLGSVEFNMRQELFTKRMELIAAHNARPNRLWTAGLSTLTDRTDAELAQLKGWRHVSLKGSSGDSALLAERVKVLRSPAAEVDWRNLSMAVAAPDQGGCGSCWAVAAASMMEARFEAQTKRTRTFSSQQLVNCVPNPQSCGGDGGCQGATVELAMQYVEEMGLEDGDTVPYHGRDMKCTQPARSASFLESLLHRRKRLNGGSKIGLQSWHRLPENRALPLMDAVMDGPVAISVAAAPWSLYSSGIFDGCDRDAVIDHAVVLFGYGSENGVNYWRIRNSWGRRWGERGFIRLLRQATPKDDDAFCGTDTNPGAGLACKPYPKSVRVCGMCGMLYDSVAANFALPSVDVS